MQLQGLGNRLQNFFDGVLIGFAGGGMGLGARRSRRNLVTSLILNAAPCEEQGLVCPPPLLSGYKPNRISWLGLSSNSDWESNASNTCKILTIF